MWVVQMTKRLIDLDDELLAAAQRELGTRGVRDTVRLALRQAATTSARARQVSWLGDDGLAELSERGQREEVWRAGT
jgi:Arc/MetJ family transcription regulator